MDLRNIFLSKGFFVFITKYYMFGFDLSFQWRIKPLNGSGIKFSWKLGASLFIKLSAYSIFCDNFRKVWRVEEE